MIMLGEKMSLVAFDIQVKIDRVFLDINAVHFRADSLDLKIPP